MHLVRLLLLTFALGFLAPLALHAVWWLSQFRRWGMVDTAPDYTAIADQVMRPDLYEAAMKELAYEHGGESNAPGSSRRTLLATPFVR